MLKYRDVNLTRTGFLGIVLVLLVVAVGLQPERLISWASAPDILRSSPRQAA